MFPRPYNTLPSPHRQPRPLLPSYGTNLIPTTSRYLQNQELIHLWKTIIKHIDQYIPNPKWVAFAVMREHTYPKNFPKHNKSSLANQGLVHDGNNTLSCVYCKFDIKLDPENEPHNSTDIYNFHKLASSDTCAIFNAAINKINNIRGELNFMAWKLKDMRDRMVLTAPIKVFPEFVDLETRIDSFSNCKNEAMFEKRKQYAENGFFYRFAGIIQCYYCGGCLHNLKDPLKQETNDTSHDIVEYLHAYFYRDCLHCKLCTSKGILSSASNEFANVNNKITWLMDTAIEKMQNDVSYRLKYQVYDLEASINEENFRNFSTKTATVKYVNEITNNDNEEIKTENEEEKEKEENGNVTELSSKITQKKDDEAPQNNTCAVCLTNIPIVLFSPCNHLVCCKRCTLLLETSNCVICRQQIHKYVLVKYA